MKITQISTILLVCIVCVAFPLQAQQTKSYQQPEAAFRSAMGLFEKEQYEASRAMFTSVIEQIQDPYAFLTAESMYFSALCNVFLYHKNAAHEMLAFIYRFPQSSRINEAYYYLGTYYYNEKQYTSAIDAFNKVDVRDLPQDLKHAFYFKKGYAQFSNNRYEQAKPNFFMVKDADSKYAPLATYYYAYICYTEGNDETALRNFETLKRDENFGKIIPYYILQIYYRQEKYDLVLQEAPAQLVGATPKRAAEISRLIGESCYYLEKYEEALPYLQLFYAQSPAMPNRDDLYMLGYTYYSLEKYDTAILYFQKAVVDNKSDALQQNALYYLGDSYLKKGLFKFAQVAFLDASKFAYDPRIQEDAFYNYAKLSYQIAFLPYSESIENFQTYLTNYPNSKHAKEIEGYLVNMFLTTKNYAAAYQAIQKIELKDTKLKEAYQRIVYNMGVQLMNKGNNTEAVKMFDEAMQYNLDDKIAALTLCRKAEIDYQLGKYQAAVLDYEHFFISYGNKKYPDVDVAHYNAGYAYMKTNAFSKASTQFLRYIDSDHAKSHVVMKNDAIIRMGDAYFMQKSFSKAIEYYDEAIAANAQSKDYAYYQKALSLGALAKFDKKIETLQQMIKESPSSLHMPAAINELASTYLIEENDIKALEYYQLLATKYPQTSYGRTATLKQGLIYYNMDNDEKAINTLASVITQHPGTEEAKEALMTMRKIYVEMNKVDDFFEFAKSVKGTQINPGEQDSLTYIAAENRYTMGKYDEAITGFQHYLKKYPEGFFVLEASYYLAECQYQTGDQQDAVLNYEKVLAMQDNRFTPEALKMAAAIHFNKKNFAKAASYFARMKTMADDQEKLLYASTWEARSLFKAEDYQKFIPLAEQLLSMPKLSPDVKDEILHHLAQAAQKTGNQTLAAQSYKQLEQAKNPDIKAEALYYDMEQLYAKGEYLEAERKIFDFINQSLSNEYYLAKAYILWGDIYKERGNLLQAKQTYQSIIDNYQGADLVDVAQQKWNTIVEQEEKAKEQEKAKRIENNGGTDELLIVPADEE